MTENHTRGLKKRKLFIGKPSDAK